MSSTGSGPGLALLVLRGDRHAVRERGGPVIGVIGGSGGVGSSSFAAVLALVAAPALLVDLDAAAGGVDVLLGIEAEPGARWSGLHVAGGNLDPDVLVAGLPPFGGTAVLAADAAVDPDAIAQVVGAGRRRGPVVLDLPRAATAVRDAGIANCDLVVVLARADVSGLVAAHTAATAVSDAGGAESTAGVVVRRGDVEPSDAAHLVGLPLLGVLPTILGGRFVLDARRPPRGSARLAAGVLSGVGR